MTTLAIKGSIPPAARATGEGRRPNPAGCPGTPPVGRARHLGPGPEAEVKVVSGLRRLRIFFLP